MFTQFELGELGEIITGKTPKKSVENNYLGKDVPFIKPDDLTKNNIKNVTSSNEFVSFEGAATGRAVGKGTVLVTCIGIIGKVGIVDVEQAIFNQQINAIIPNGEIVLSKYLAYILHSMQKKLQDKANAPVVPIINKTDFSKLKVSVPSIEYQQKVVELLDEAQVLIEKRQSQITALDELIQSLFLEMFGDPKVNNFNWKLGTIKDLTESTQYGSSQKASETEGRYPILRMNNITYSGNWDFSRLKYIDLSEEELEKYTVRSGDILFNRTNSKELVGKTAVYNGEETYAYAGYLIRLRLSEKANPEFVASYLNSKYGKSILLNKAKSIVGMANINAKELQTIPIYLPPRQLQDEFALKKRTILEKKNDLKSGLFVMENLYNSLFQKAFKGELFQEQ